MLVVGRLWRRCLESAWTKMGDTALDRIEETFERCAVGELLRGDSAADGSCHLMVRRLRREFRRTIPPDDSPPIGEPSHGTDAGPFPCCRADVVDGSCAEPEPA